MNKETLISPPSGTHSLHLGIVKLLEYQQKDFGIKPRMSPWYPLLLVKIFILGEQEKAPSCNSNNVI